MNEPKDDLLADFENPDMAVPEMPQEAVSAAQETPVMEDNQNAMPNVSVEPAVEVNRDVKAEEPKAEGGSLKKNLAFIIIICALIAVFIFFLPTIMSFISGGSY